VSRTIERATKGQRTRERIVERAAELFNTRGVAGASMAEISEATGLEKGGVYNHFASKEALAIAAFDYGAGIVLARIETALASHGSALGKLRAVLDLYRGTMPRLFVGGCPIMNTAIEADDTNPELRKRARATFDRWMRAVARVVEAGMATGEIRATVDPYTVANVTLSSIEGAVMLSTLYRSRAPLQAAVAHLEAYFDTLAMPAQARRT
jgi:TetR/AcrR family transcriptional repressor of nem operon